MTTLITTSPHLSIDEAKQRQLKPLTQGYEPFEYTMLDNVIADMVRNNATFALVAENPKRPSTLAVYKK